MINGRVKDHSSRFFPQSSRRPFKQELGNGAFFFSILHETLRGLSFISPPALPQQARKDKEEARNIYVDAISIWTSDPMCFKYQYIRLDGIYRPQLAEKS